MQRLAEFFRSQNAARAGAAQPVFRDGDHLSGELRLPETGGALGGVAVAGNDYQIGMARQYLFAADLRPGRRAVGKDVVAAAQRYQLVLQRIARGRKQRPLAEL